MSTTAAVGLSLETIGQLDAGIAGATIQSAIDCAVKDLEDRGHDGKPRKVTITIEMVKVGDEGATVVVDAKYSIPNTRTKKTLGQLSYKTGGVGIQFQPLSPENPAQEPLPFDERRKAR